MKKILAVASGGGHWSQMMMLSTAFGNCHVHYVTTHINLAVNDSLENQMTRVDDADFSQKIGLIRLAFEVLWIVIKQRPDIIISTGAAPGFFAIVFGKMLKAKTIWVDSIANYERPSLSGAKVKTLCDLYLTQWPHQNDNTKTHYWGHLI